ncbi:MAG: SGNH/GDSL hydrolase family protein, partial [Oscillospiraceae bacterium]|nr:SGNH/GDSL hydrolase family protein [Oscillospiraceae bacterium]
QNIPSADLIVVFMGTNDYGHETPLGTVEDTQDGTFYGALDVIVPALVANHPSSKIVFVTPLHRYGFGTSAILGTAFTSDSIPNGVGATLGDYVTALKTVCANNGVSVIDLYTECTLDPTDAAVRETYMPDGLHPNAAGHELIAGIMESHIREYTPIVKVPTEDPAPDEGDEENTSEADSELIYGNRFASGFDRQNRASSRVNYYLKAGTVITLKDPAAMQWACAKTSDETGSDNLGYFPDSQWTDKETAVVEDDGWVGFTFKYRDETRSFDLSKLLSDYITIEEPHTHSYISAVTPPTCTEQGYTTYNCECGDSYAADYVDALKHDYLAQVTYPTGTKNGYTDYSCSQCGDAYRAAWLDEAAYTGMTLACIGDSITAAVGVTKDETDYVKLLAQQLGMEYIRLGVSGTTLCTDGSRTCNITRLTEGYLQGADIVTIAMGINDFCAAGKGYYELGDINSTDSSTIYGAVRMWCERIEELRKTDSLSDTRFYFVTPLITSWNNSVTSARNWDQSKTNIHGYTLRDLCNAIIEVAALYDVPVIDLNLLSGMYYVDAEDNTVAEFGGDG